MLDNKQITKSLNHSNVNDSTIIVNNGLSYTEVESICKNVCALEIQRNSNDALDKAQCRLNEITDEIISRIEREAHDYIYQFKEPDIQYSLQNSIIPYVRTGNSEMKDQLIDLFIDRLKSKSCDTEQTIIDEAISIIPSLSQSSIALLASIAFSDICIIFSVKFDQALEQIGKVFEKLSNLNRLDIAHLIQQNCANGGLTGIGLNDSMEAKLQKSYDIYFRRPFSQNIIDTYFKDFPNCILPNIPPIPYFYRNEGNNSLDSIYTSSQSMKQQMISNGQKSLIPSLDKYMSKVSIMNLAQIRELLINKDPNWNYAFDALNKDEVKSIRLSPVGIYIGISYLKRIAKLNISFNTFYLDN